MQVRLKSVLAFALALSLPSFAIAQPQFLPPTNAMGSVNPTFLGTLTGPNASFSGSLTVGGQPVTGGASRANGVTGSTFWSLPSAINSQSPSFGNFSTAATDVGGTSSFCYTMPYAGHDFQAVFQHYHAQSGEQAAPNPITITASIADSYGDNPEYLKVGGHTTFTLGNGWSQVKTEKYGLSEPAGANVCVRTYVQLSLPPTSPTAAAGTASGTLTTSQTVYYKITQIAGAQGESGPTSELSVTPSSGSVNLGWSYNPLSVMPTAFNIYRTTVSGDESYLTTIGASNVTPGKVFSWTDTGAVSPPSVTGGTGGVSNTTLTITANNSGVPLATGDFINGGSVSLVNIASSFNTGGYLGTVTLSTPQTIANGTTITFGAPPPANQYYEIGWGFNTTAFPNEATNYISQGTTNANGTNQVLTPGTSWGALGVTSGYAPTALLFAPSAGANVPIVGIFGDSIAAGVQDIQPTGRGFLAYALQSASIAYYNAGIGAESFSSMAANGNAIAFALARIDMANGVTDAISEYGSNDIANGASFATVQQSAINYWIELAKRAPRVWQTTILPRITAAPGATPTTATSAAPNGETPVSGFGTGGAMQSFNAWMRCSYGAAPLVSATNLTPAVCGAAGAIYAGQTGHPLHGWFDPCAAVEVNSSNVLTQGGTFWITNGTAGYATTDGIHPTSAVVTALLAPTVPVASFTAISGVP